MAQTLIEIRQSVSVLVTERTRDVDALRARLKTARKELRDAKGVLKKLGGGVVVSSAPVVRDAAPKQDDIPAARGRVLAYLRNNGGTRPGELKESVGCGMWAFEKWRGVIDALKNEGLIEVRGATNAAKVHLKLQ